MKFTKLCASSRCSKSHRLKRIYTIYIYIYIVLVLRVAALAPSLSEKRCAKKIKANPKTLIRAEDANANGGTCFSSKVAAPLWGPRHQVVDETTDGLEVAPSR
jgi:hypothetical protein